MAKTAIRLFNQESYTTVGMDRIFAESGVSKMTVYKYFIIIL
ncbi:TetR family transcriptional regulator [Acinetobacter baumannii]|nr:helix-turn-helix transcriptional regulator [Acinetobacter baumannii]TPT49447.1 helix-turn-helix transcriptional regulator [Acinetobacter baumannii]SSQ19177.1 TetR family transcriptional regulator [Acinetobacter baumannii]SSU52174.1 TetR family transcriptional regulator [Acinetobacter baumannii]HAV5336464.1 TetR family transcriptional regulator [Acinetobacter baumannii]